MIDFLTDELMAKLIANCRVSTTSLKHWPVVRLFVPNTNCVWLITEMDPTDRNIFFGLCDLDCGFPELGFVDLIALTHEDEIPVQRDLSFQPRHPLSVYAAADILADFAHA